MFGKKRTNVEMVRELLEESEKICVRSLAEYLDIDSILDMNEEDRKMTKDLLKTYKKMKEFALFQAEQIDRNDERFLKMEDMLEKQGRLLEKLLNK